MNRPELLLCTNGKQAGQAGLEYGLWLAGQLRSPVALLGVAESLRQQGDVQARLGEAVSRLVSSDLPYTCQMQTGRVRNILPDYAAGRLTVIGRLGRSVLRDWIRGPAFRVLLERIGAPLLYVPEAHNRLDHMLLCLGGLEYTFSMEHVGFQLAHALGAQVTLLHVVEPVSRDYPLAQRIHDHWRDILNTDTPQARNLHQALAEARRAGLNVEFKVRHGPVVHEILAEIGQGNYDLVGLGSPYSSRSLRHLYLPNVTADVAESTCLPVLTVRHGFELIADPPQGE